MGVKPVKESELGKSYLFLPRYGHGGRLRDVWRGYPNNMRVFGCVNHTCFYGCSHPIYRNIEVDERKFRSNRYGTFRWLYLKEEHDRVGFYEKSVRLNLFEPDWCAEEEKKSLYHDDLPTGVWE